jgi:XTP/dITP diphosphohydrolase/ATP diphosphatase
MPQNPLSESIAIMARLRAPGGCPWDRAQTFDSIKRHTLEETYEVFDAIDRRAWPDLKDELGDLLLQVLFYAQMAADEGYFTIEDVAANLNAKLIRRHPHIFADAVAHTPDDVKQTWESVKQQERSAKPSAPQHLLDEVTRHQPAFLEAAKLGKKAASVGFDWPDTQGLIDKLHEETNELEAELQNQPLNLQKAEDELGDLLFTAVNLARHLKLEPEFALRNANAKFRRRFNAIESTAGNAQALARLTPEELDQLWRTAKSTPVAGPSDPKINLSS